MKFNYAGEMHDLFDIIDREKDFVTVEDEGRVIDIILKHGILKLAKRFNFSDHGLKVSPTIIETKQYGTVFFVEIKMSRPDDPNNSKPIEERLFYGTGEVNGLNYTSLQIPYPLAVAEVRARSRGILQELSLKVYGIDEFGEDMKKKIWATRKKGFSSKRSALPSPESKPAAKSAPKPAKPKTESKSNGIGDRNEKIRAKIQELREKMDSKGIENKEHQARIFMYALKMEKGYPKFDDFVANPQSLVDAEKLIDSGKAVELIGQED